jgi:GntR family transcriptional regulator
MPATRPESPLADARRRRADRARQVADVLRRQVLQGTFPDGLLPDEGSLSQEFGAEGLVTRVQGTGTVVVGRKYPHGLHNLLGLAETLREHGDVVNVVRAAGLVAPPPAVAARLLPSGQAGDGEAPATVVYIERLRRLNGLPLSLDLTYLAPDIGQPLLGEDLAGTDISR